MFSRGGTKCLYKKYLVVENPTYIFCGELEYFLHPFWSCRWAQLAWNWPLSFFRPFMLNPFSWPYAIMGDPI